MALKEASVAELANKFESSTAVLLTEYRGLTVGELKELRDSIRQDAEYAVVKNTLTKIAAGRQGSRGSTRTFRVRRLLLSCTVTRSPSRRVCAPSPRHTLFS